MGMFDYVEFVCECPNCGTEVEDFQTKDGYSLSAIQPHECQSFYSECPNCGTWIDCWWESICMYGKGEGAIRVDRLVMRCERDDE